MACGKEGNPVEKGKGLEACGALMLGWEARCNLLEGRSGEVQIMQEMMRLWEEPRLLPHRTNVERLSKVGRAFFTAQKTMVSLNSSLGPWLSSLNLLYCLRTWVAAPAPCPASSVDLASSSQSKIKHQVELLLIPMTFSLNPHWSTSPPVTAAGLSLLLLYIPSPLHRRRLSSV